MAPLGELIEDTYAEAFDGLYARLLITAKNPNLLRKAAYNSTALPLTVLGESEGGIEKWLTPNQTPDNRLGVIIQIWVGYRKNAVEQLEKELGKRIRQGILVVPTTTVFNAAESVETLDIMHRVGHCGDGYEYMENYCGRNVINIPIMMGEFRIERYLGYARGVMGGNLWFLCESIDAALEVGERALEAVRKVEGVVTPFDICSAGSKVETKYPEIGPTTNHPYCPTLREKIPDSKVPEGVTSIPEIVINGVSLEAVKEAMRVTMRSVMDMKGLSKISAGNYGGKLGRYKIRLRELV